MHRSDAADVSMWRLFKMTRTDRVRMLPLPALACASLLLGGCVTVPLTRPAPTNLIEYQIDRIDDFSPIPAFRDDEDEKRPVVRTVSSRTLISRHQTPPVRTADFERKRPSASSSSPISRPVSKWQPQPPTDRGSQASRKDPDSPDWEAIVRAIGPSTRSAARRTADLAGLTYDRGRRLITDVARYAGTKLAHSPSSPSGGYMVTARPGEVGRGGLCWPAIGRVSRGFDLSINHKGIDICAPEGSPVYAARGGKVVYSGSKLSGYGNVVILDHGGGFASVYAHNSRNLVRDGEFVRQGQQIALMGQTGDASTPHCHFEMRFNTQPIDPRPFLP